MSSLSAGLNHEEAVFLERQQRGLRARLILGWMCILLPAALGLIVLAQGAQIVGRIQRLERPVVESLAAENRALVSIQPKTAAEGALAQRLVDRNKQFAELVRMTLWGSMALIAVIVTQGLIGNGVSLLMSRRETQHYLRIIEQLQQRLTAR